VIAFYLDAHIPRAIALGLRMRGIDVLTAQEDGAAMFSDAELLDRATTLGRVLFTFDGDLLAEAAKKQRLGQPFSGVVYAHPLRVTIGQCIHDLELVAKAGEPEDLRNQVLFLPL